MSPSSVYVAGSAAPEETPRTPKAIPHRGGTPNPSAAALQAQFQGAVQRVDVIWGDTNVVVEAARAQEIVRWLHDDASQRYDYLVDVTAVEFRDPEAPIEVVWHLRSLPYRRFLRLKALLPKTGPLVVPSVWPIYKSADWLERECFDMFGIRFEGHPLRKDFPLRGRFSRAEQLRQTLAQNPEARYSMEELSIAEAFSELPDDMRKRLSGGENTGE